MHEEEHVTKQCRRCNTKKTLMCIHMAHMLLLQTLTSARAKTSCWPQPQTCP